MEDQVSTYALFDTRDEARAAIAALNGQDRYGWSAWAQFYGRAERYMVEGHRKSKRNGQPLVLCTDGTMQRPDKALDPTVCPSWRWAVNRSPGDMAECILSAGHDGLHRAAYGPNAQTWESGPVEARMLGGIK